MNIQAFQAGDHVRVADDLGPSMSHFKAACEAVVVGSYADQYGGSNRDSYTLYLHGGGRCSWYYGSQLRLLEHNRLDLLLAWEAEDNARRNRERDPDWIWTHTEDVLTHPPTASVIGLAADLGLTVDDLWGPHGEGFVFAEHCLLVLAHAAPFLRSGDKHGWMAYAADVRRKTQLGA